MLTFDALRKANVARLPLFKNGKGKPAHSKSDGSDWKLSAWSNATLGELGELANLIKKLERGDFELDDRANIINTYRDLISLEIGDVQIYLDLLAYQLRIDLGEAVKWSFNGKSDQLGIPVKLGEKLPKKGKPCKGKLKTSK